MFSRREPRAENYKPSLKKPPPLDYAQVVAHRRACRVAEKRQLDSNNTHFYDLKNTVELENAFHSGWRVIFASETSLPTSRTP